MANFTTTSTVKVGEMLGRRIARAVDTNSTLKNLTNLGRRGRKAVRVLCVDSLETLTFRTLRRQIQLQCNSGSLDLLDVLCLPRPQVSMLHQAARGKNKDSTLV